MNVRDTAILVYLSLARLLEEILMLSKENINYSLSELYICYLEFFRFNNFLPTYKLSLILGSGAVCLIVHLCRSGKKEHHKLFLMFVFFFMLINAVLHMAVAVYTKKYIPGLVTSSMLIVPYTLYFVKNSEDDTAMLSRAGLVSLIIYMPVVLGSWYVADFILNVLLH